MITKENVDRIKDKWYGSLYSDIWSVVDPLLKERDNLLERNNQCERIILSQNEICNSLGERIKELEDQVKLWKGKRPFSQHEIDNARMIAEAQTKTFRLDDREARISYLEEHNKKLEDKLEGENHFRVQQAKRISYLEHRNKILESSKCSQEMLDDVKKLFEEMKESRDAYREVARTQGHVCHRKNCDCGDQIDAEAQRIISEKRT